LQNNFRRRKPPKEKIEMLNFFKFKKGERLVSSESNRDRSKAYKEMAAEENKCLGKLLPKEQYKKNTGQLADLLRR